MVISGWEVYSDEVDQSIDDLFHDPPGSAFSHSWDQVPHNNMETPACQKPNGNADLQERWQREVALGVCLEDWGKYSSQKQDGLRSKSVSLEDLIGCVRF